MQGNAKYRSLLKSDQVNNGSVVVKRLVLKVEVKVNVQMNMPSPNRMMYQVGRLPPEHSNHCSSVCHNACASTSLIKMEICVLETNKLNIHPIWVAI